MTVLRSSEPTQVLEPLIGAHLLRSRRLNQLNWTKCHECADGTLGGRLLGKTLITTLHELLGTDLDAKRRRRYEVTNELHGLYVWQLDGMMTSHCIKKSHTGDLTRIDTNEDYGVTHFQVLRFVTS